jgi:hypothetical protein
MRSHREVRLTDMVPDILAAMMIKAAKRENELRRHRK